MPSATITKDGMLKGVDSMPLAIRLLAQTVARTITAAEASVTDNSGGTASTTLAINAVTTVFANVANSSTNLAQEASTETQLGALRSSLATLFTVVNNLANKLDIPLVTYNGGGTDGSGTVAAIGVSVTAATTGVQAARMNVLKDQFNDAIYVLSTLTNKVLEGAGVAPLVVNFTDTYGTIAAIDTTNTGTAADPGVTKASVDAALTVWRINIATIAARLNVVTVAGNPLIIGA